MVFASPANSKRMKESSVVDQPRDLDGRVTMESVVVDQPRDVDREVFHVPTGWTVS